MIYTDKFPKRKTENILFMLKIQQRFNTMLDFLNSIYLLLTRKQTVNIAASACGFLAKYIPI